MRALALAFGCLTSACAPDAGAVPVCAAGAGRADAPIAFTGRERRFAADIGRDRARLASERVATIGLGDSIMQRWPDAVLARMFGGPAVGMGVGGYTVGQVLAQIDDTDWRGRRPRTVVLMIGTNDLARDAGACDLVAGIEAIRERVARIFPGARLVVVSVLPRGADLSEFGDRIAQVNVTLAARAKEGRFTYLDANAVFARACAPARQTGRCEYLQGPKNVHPTPAGYEMLARSQGR
jgi:platelet-activating factor acetylhydrolase IB subunit beta/gamma